MVTTIPRVTIDSLFQKIIILCNKIGFEIIEFNCDDKIIKARKSSLLFWKSLRLELKLHASSPGSHDVKTSVKIFRNKKLQHQMEEKFLSSLNEAL